MLCTISHVLDLKYLEGRDMPFIEDVKGWKALDEPWME